MENKKNYDKYLFERVFYVKRHLPLAIVKAYVRDNPDVTYKNIKSYFECLGFARAVRTAEEIYKSVRDPKVRYHMNDPILLSDGTIIYVSNQWGAGINIEGILAFAKFLGYEIAIIKA